MTDIAVPLRDTDEAHVGTCGATVIDAIYRDVVRPGGTTERVLDRRERHQCSRNAGQCVTASGGTKHVCAHGRAWAGTKSEGA